MPDEPSTPDEPAFRPQAFPFGIDWSQHRADHVTKVGVVMRTRTDRPILLPRGLDSVVAQTFDDWHLVVVNHGGDPGTVESAVDAVVGRAAGKIEIVHLDAGGGMERAANAGLDRLDAEFVVIHDDDDTWLPEFLARTVAFLDDDEHHTFGAVVTHGVKRWERVVDGVVELIADEEFNEPKAYVDNQRLFGWNRILTNHTLIRSAVFDVLGPLNESLAVIGDWEFNLRIATVTDIGLIPEVLARYHLRVDGDNLNTITAGEGSHLETDARLRAALLRRYLAADPSRLGLLVAMSHDDEMARRLDERILQVAEQIDWRTHHTGNRINDMHDRIIAMDERLAALDLRLADMDGRLTEVRTDTSRLRAAAAALGSPVRPLRRARRALAAPARMTGTPPPGRLLHVCFVVHEWFPTRINGIARVVHARSTGLAARGHTVRVITRSPGERSADLEGEVWVHRIPVEHHDRPIGEEVPQPLWDHSASVLEELVRIDAEQRIDVVDVPNWDVEGLAAILDGRFTTVLGLYTSLFSYVETDGRFLADDPVVRAVLDAERRCYQGATGFTAASHAIVAEIEQYFGVSLPRERLAFIPHGLPALGSPALRRYTPGTRDDPLEVLFVGRLEARKGIDTLLAAIPRIVAEVRHVRFTIVGDDAIPSPSGRTFREMFESSWAWGELAERVTFTGVVDDDELDRCYRRADLFVAPSRFESFGLIALEAMRVGTPVVAGDTSGLREAIGTDGAGVLVPPGDAQALADAVVALLRDPGARRARSRGTGVS